MDELKKLLAAIAATLRQVRVDDSDDNWSKMLGCKNALAQALAMIDKIEEEARNDGADD